MVETSCNKIVYKIPYRRARAWPSGCIVQPLGRVRRASKGILHTSNKIESIELISFEIERGCNCINRNQDNKLQPTSEKNRGKFSGLYVNFGFGEHV